MTNKDVSSESYLLFRTFLEKQCGIVLGENKQYLVRSRLASLLYKHKYGSADELISVVVKGIDRNLLQDVIDAMTTNETLWFRDNYPFDLLIKDYSAHGGLLSNYMCNTMSVGDAIDFKHIEFKSSSLLFNKNIIQVLRLV